MASLLKRVVTAADDGGGMRSAAKANLEAFRAAYWRLVAKTLDEHKPRRERDDLDEEDEPDREDPAYIFRVEMFNAVREVVEPLARAVVPLVETLSEADTDAAKKEKKAQESLFQMKLEASRKAASVQMSNQKAEMTHSFAKELQAKVGELTKDDGTARLLHLERRQLPLGVSARLAQGRDLLVHLAARHLAVELSKLLRLLLLGHALAHHLLCQRGLALRERLHPLP